MIDGVTFDWWNTLALTTEDQDRRLRELRVERLLKATNGLCSREVLLGAYDRQTALLQEKWGHDIDPSPEEQVRGFLGLAGLDARDAALVEKVSEALGGALLQIPPSLFPHVRETLAALREEGVSVGMVSNSGRTWGHYLRRVQDSLGIGKFFDVRVFSDEVGVRKPDPAIFRTALEKLGLSAYRVVHVGDDIDADIAGARASGMRAIWFNTGFWRDARTDKADGEIHEMGELPGLLARWRS